MSTTDERATTTQRPCRADAGDGDPGLRPQLLGVGPAVAAGGLVHRRPAPVAVPAVAAGRRPRGRGLPGPHPGRRAHRPLRRPGDVPDHLVGHLVPVLYLGLFGHSSLAALLVGGFFLGIAGTAFAVGVPFVSAWFPPQRRGFAVGVFGAGMGGTAISALTTVKLVNAHSMATPFVITAVVLTAYGVIAALVLRDAPGRTVPTESLGRRLRGAAALPITWQAAALYAIGFGGYVAFSVYLPDLSEERLRPHPRGRLEPDGRLRPRRGPDAAGRRLALRPGTRRIGPDRRLRGGRRRRVGPVDHAGARTAGHDRVPVHGGCPRRRVGSHVRAGRPARARGQGRLRHGHRRRGRRPRWLHPAAGDGLDLRPLRRLRHRPARSLRDGRAGAAAGALVASDVAPRRPAP